MREYLKILRESVEPDVWSLGVKLQRNSDFLTKTITDDEIVMKVAERDQKLARWVSLWPNDEDWHCDCNGPDDPCPHVIAAAIAVSQARDRGVALQEAEFAKIGYRFKRKSGELSFERVLIYQGKTSPVYSIALIQGREGAPSVAPSKEDLAIDLLLQKQNEGVLPTAILSRLLPLLEACSNITIDGQDVKALARKTGFIVKVVDERAGVRIFGIQDPEIKEVFRNGVALCSDGLRPIAHGQLSPQELKWLAEGRSFGMREYPELIGEILPQLAKKLPVEILTKRLPEAVDDFPRLVVETVQDGTALRVHPKIVYGDPIIAEVVGGRLVSKGGAIPVRRPIEENKIRLRVQTELVLELDRPAIFTGEDAVAFAEKLHHRGLEATGDGTASFARFAELVPTMNLQRKGKETHISVEFTVSGAKTADPGAVLKAWQEGVSLVPLLDGGWAPLPKAWLERFGDTLTQLVGTQNEKGIDPCLLPSLVGLYKDLDQPLPPDLSQLQATLEHFESIPAPVLPADLRADLRTYQRDGIAWLAFLNNTGMGGALLADDMGLGKTLQAICLLRKRTLVVGPTSVLYNWKAEIARFRPRLKVALFHGQGRQLDRDADVVLTTYALLRMDVDLLSAQNWQLVVLDEAQNIKNPTSNVAQAAFRLQSEFRIALTGTPIENSLDDLWSQFHFINRGLLGGQKDFQTWYARPISNGDERAAKKLRARIKPFLLRRTKEQVAKELPPRTDTILYCDLEPNERDLYDTLLGSVRAEVAAQLGQGQNVMQILEVLLRLRQAVCHPALLEHAVPTSSKLDLLVEHLQECVDGGHKALVFSQWTRFLDLIEKPLRQHGLTFDRIDGSTRDRQGIVDRFQAPGGPSILLLSLKAAGVGLNLTSADYVFIMDPWWNPAVEDQAADRAHRIGQTRPVMVHRLVAKDTVEEKILALQERKRGLAETVVAAGNLNQALSRDDLLSLLV